ncbi:MAG TPA: CDP-glucose 4,6-dehydratase, partial [Rhodospirillales bacterium]|nr:CDP-glucose 4,6-dehydratase [Rhodospirillales bacterium]
LVTGHTGFKGVWLCSWLTELGAEVAGYAHPPGHASRLFDATGLVHRMTSHIGDMRDLHALRDVVRRERPEVVFHLAGRAVVLEALKDPVETFATNVIGTLNLLEALRAAPDLRAVVAVTSDKVYREPGGRCREDDPLGGEEPYSASKAAAEHVIAAYRHCYLTPEDGIGLAAARAGNVVGGGDFSPHRLIPDLVRGILAGRVVDIRHPAFARPWQHVLDALHGYLLLAERLARAPARYGGSWNFGPPAERPPWPVARIATRFVEAFGSGAWRPSPRPPGVEVPRQHLCVDRARDELGWRCLLDTETTVAWTAAGYRRLAAGDGADWLFEQIARFTEGLHGRAVMAETDPRSGDVLHAGAA